MTRRDPIEVPADSGGESAICPCGCGRPLPGRPRGLRFDDAGRVMEEWCESLGLTLAEVRAQDRRPQMVAMRREIAVYMRAHHWSLPEIGRFLERDHTTILHLTGRTGPARPRLVVADAPGEVAGHCVTCGLGPLAGDETECQLCRQEAVRAR